MVPEKIVIQAYELHKDCFTHADLDMQIMHHEKADYLGEECK